MGAVDSMKTILNKKPEKYNYLDKLVEMVFPVVMNGRESWTVKKAEH